jgi:hypothetical protein
MTKYYCEAFTKTYDADFHKKCFWELGEVPKPEKSCFGCERYRRIQNEKKIIILASKNLPSQIKPIPEIKKTKVKKRIHKKIKYESEEKTRSELYRLAFLEIIEGHLKYLKDPNGMLDDPKHRIFAIPFLDYAKGEISFSEADRRINTIRSVVCSDSAEIGRQKLLRIQHEKITGRDLIQDIHSLESQDEKAAKDAVLHIVKSFPRTQFEFSPVKNVVARAIVEDDFGEAFGTIPSKRRVHAKRKLNLISFKILNEDVLNNSNLTEADVCRIADEQHLKYESRESLLKYLRREGIKIRLTKQSKHVSSSGTHIKTLRAIFGKDAISERKVEFKKYVSGDISIREVVRSLFERDLVNERRSEFQKYLFGDVSIQQVKKTISILKKSLKIK